MTETQTAGVPPAKYIGQDVIKDREYFLSLDLGSVPQSTKSAPAIRATDEQWGDLLTAIWFRSKEDPVPIQTLLDAVGEPLSMCEVDR